MYHPIDKLIKIHLQEKKYVRAKNNITLLFSIFISLEDKITQVKKKFNDKSVEEKKEQAKKY